MTQCKSVLWLALTISLLGGRGAQAQSLPPEFRSPYAGEAALETYLVFQAAPRANVPDGQVHWRDAQVPGIDILGPDAIVRSVCHGRAWSLAGGDTVGGGGQFVAVECETDVQGRDAQGWQMIAFHACEVLITQSIDPGQRQYTRVQVGTPLSRECTHTHLSLGYYARADQKRDLPCPQWYVQGRYWVNPICLSTTRAALAADLSLPLYLAPTDDWELNLLRPEMIEPARQASWLVIFSLLALYVAWALFRPRPPAELNHPVVPAVPAIFKSSLVLVTVFMLALVSAGPVWPVSGHGPLAYSADSPTYQALAQATGFGDARLLEAFYRAAVPRNAQGRPAQAGEAGKVFPPEAAAAIPFGETNTADWGLVDPTQPGPHGQFRAWEAVVARWPASAYEQTVLGLSISRMAQQQRDGLRLIARSPAMQHLGRQLGKTIRAEDLYGSSAGAVGRTQILPGYFAPTALCGDMVSMDVWNDPNAIAECTTRYLTVSGCRGSWWQTGDVWSALCSYNPGAWNVPRYQWYWDVLQDRMTRLNTSAVQLGVQQGGGAVDPASPQAAPMARLSLGSEHYVSTPVLGLLFTQAVLQNGQTSYKLPAQLNDWARALAPQNEAQRDQVRNSYRLFRAWVLLFYTPEQRLDLGLDF